MGDYPGRIKVCGITNLEDALLACELGAWAVGFIFYPPSPRSVEVDQASSIASCLDPSVEKVGVFVDAPFRWVLHVKEKVGLTIAQLHGKEDRSMVEELRPHFNDVWKAVRVGEDLPDLKEFEGVTLLLDSFVKGKPGGTGRVFRWDLAVRAKKHGKVILAGGLTAENVREAILKVRPFAVDVASGVESSPGKKDRLKVELFFSQARKAWDQLAAS